MNNCSGGSQRHVCMWKSHATIPKLYVSLLLNMHMKYDTRMLFAFSTDMTIHIKTKQMNELSLLNDIVLSW